MLLVEERHVLAAFKETGKRQGWFGTEGKMIVAVSGGSDSVALLWLLLLFRSPEDLIVAHVNHGIRKDHAERDARFVKELAGTWNLSHMSATFDVPGLKKKGESLEEAGRRLRYDFLENSADRVGAKWIAVGHTADDQVETVLHNILRGCGIHGLAGIPERRGRIVRPLMEISRCDLMTLLSSRGLSWVTDDTNEDTNYMRNRIRHELIPYLETSYNPKTRDHILGLARDARKISRERQAWAREMSERIRMEVPCTVRAWDRNTLTRQGTDKAVDFLVEECNELGMRRIERRRLKTLSDLLEKKEPWRFQWQDRIEMCGTTEKVLLLERHWLSERKPPTQPFSFEGSEGTLSWGFWIFSWRHVSCCRPDSSGPWTIFLPEEEEHGCLLTEVSTFQKEYRLATPVPWCFRRQWPVVITPSGKWWIPAYNGSIAVEDQDQVKDPSGVIIEAKPATGEALDT
jgi:tRNA(Ile)-lysidine synthase